MTANKIFFTLILIQDSGRDFDRFKDVIHAPAFVFEEILVYLLELKKVISFFLAFIKLSMS